MPFKFLVILFVVNGVISRLVFKPNAAMLVIYLSSIIFTINN